MAEFWAFMFLSSGGCATRDAVSALSPNDMHLLPQSIDLVQGKK